METHGVALGYVGDKIRYIVLIRVRFTTELFFRTRIWRIERMFVAFRQIPLICLFVGF